MSGEENITQVTEHLFVGDQYSCCQFIIDQFEIKGLICIDEYVSDSCKGLIPTGIERLEFEMDDRDEEDLKQHLDKVYPFIDRFVEKKERVLVHCLAGASRSCSIMIGYLCRKYGYNFNQAYGLVCEKRKACCPNRGFINQLRALFS